MVWFSRRAPTLPGCAGAVVIALCLVSSSVLAQTEAGAAAKEASNDQVIITHMPAAKSRIRNFLDRILGRSHGSNLETTGSEVVSVPKAQSSRFRQRLEALGAKVITLRDKWNHILRRSKDPVPLPPTQQVTVDKITALPETVNLGMVKMPDPAVVELALKGQGEMKDHFSRVVLPLRDDKDITLVRTQPTDKTEGGFTWSGEVEETGERAVLMLWRDGHLSGYFGYKGHVCTVNQVAGEDRPGQIAA